MPKKQVIAIVDDDELAREGTTDLVKSMGFMAKAFERAEDFLKSDYLHSSSCLIADVLMPGMTGIELHHRLVEAGNITPIILITSFPNDSDWARARRPVRFATWLSHSMTKICSPASVQLSSPARRSETFQVEP